MTTQAYTAARLFDGERLLTDTTLIVTDGRVVDVVATRLPDAKDLGDHLISPGYVDLQVNGGGGTMFNAVPDAETIRKMSGAHLARGTTVIAPTLITDHFENTKLAVDAAIKSGVQALHLEGPHLDPRRAGAHAADLIRAVTPRDMALYQEAAKHLKLMLTIAPGAITVAEIHRLTASGVILSLGHSDADYETAMAFFEAGVQATTHLYNAMSASSARNPGVVGAAFASAASVSIIADGIHVHPALLHQAHRLLGDRLFLVSDAMATIGADDTRFTLNGREIQRRGDRLTLANGTLAGAHLDLARAVRVMVQQAGVPLEAALSMATYRPAELIGLSDLGRLAPGSQADFLCLDKGLNVIDVWKDGDRQQAAIKR